MVLRKTGGRRARRGLTLFEVLIVVALLALIASGVAIAAWDKVGPAKAKLTATNARTVRHAVRMWWTENDTTECPTLGQLIAGGALDRDSARRDAWGEEWKIECDGAEVIVISNGGDRQPGTEDDIRIPPA
jgi:general secretion pathway protein G